MPESFSQNMAMTDGFMEIFVCAACGYDSTSSLSFPSCSIEAQCVTVLRDRFDSRIDLSSPAIYPRFLYSGIDVDVDDALVKGCHAASTPLTCFDLLNCSSLQRSSVSLSSTVAESCCFLAVALYPPTHIAYSSFSFVDKTYNIIALDAQLPTPCSKFTKAIFKTTVAKGVSSEDYFNMLRSECFRKQFLVFFVTLSARTALEKSEVQLTTVQEPSLVQIQLRCVLKIRRNAPNRHQEFSPSPPDSSRTRTEHQTMR
eukprot:6489893-Amphidinium_carterae.1